MKLTPEKWKEYKKVLTEDLLGECRHTQDYGYDLRTGNPIGLKCAKCTLYFPIRFPDQRTFLTRDDLLACKQTLAREGLWKDFVEYAIRSWEKEHWFVDLDTPDFTAWLFRSVDENGEPHFCALVAEFMEEK